jgi:alpha-glucosidase
MLAGPADYTPGVFNFDNPVYPNTRVHATLANQLGLFVVLYSPLQMACDLPENYMLHPEEFEFIRCVPCDWERSIMLNGQIGDYIVMARQARNTDNWYIGAVTDEQARSTTITWADFLGKGDYQAIIYQDAAQADWQTNPYATAIDTLSVHRHSDPLTINMAPGGGFAIRVEKQN